MEDDERGAAVHRVLEPSGLVKLFWMMISWFYLQEIERSRNMRRLLATGALACNDDKRSAMRTLCRVGSLYLPPHKGIQKAKGELGDG